MPLVAGTRLGPYEIVAAIGAGGMGEVYKARDTRLDRTVAVKVANQRFSERFEQEARLIASLNHPHVCALYDVGPDYLVMEYIEGAPPKGPMPAEQVLTLALQAASALEAAHRKGIVHRDLKPANMLVGAGGVKLLDFGLAKVEAKPDDVTATATAVGTLVGTAAYMSPEQADGRAVDARSDIFSFGLVLYEMLSGQSAFGGDSLLSTVVAILQKEPRPLEAPVALTRVVHRCLRKDPAARFQSAAELVAALEEAAAGKVSEAAPSLAVLPFANLSADKDNEYFSDGLAEEIINALTQVPCLKVTARTSSFFFRGKDVKLADIARELNVAHVLEGSVRRAGNRIRVTAQLIRAADGVQVWSERYDRELTDVFAIQDEIAAAIVGQLSANLTGRRGCATRPANMAAYEAVLEGRHHWNQLTPASSARALDCFQRAAALESNYAPAHTGMAGYYIGLATLGLADPRPALSNARAAARRAIQLDPNDAEPWAFLATVSALLDFDWAACERECRRAIDLNPANPHARFPYAFWYLRPQGRYEEALGEADHILELDPMWNVGRYIKAMILASLGRSDAAAAAFRRALDLDSHYGLALAGLALAEARLGHTDEALASAEKAVQLHGRWPLLLGPLGSVYACVGRRQDALRIVDELTTLAERSSVAAGSLAAVHLHLGDLDHAFEWAGQAIERRDPVTASLPGIFVEPIRSDPRFTALLRKMNL